MTVDMLRPLRRRCAGEPDGGSPTTWWVCARPKMKAN